MIFQEKTVILAYLLGMLRKSFWIELFLNLPYRQKFDSSCFIGAGLGGLLDLKIHMSPWK